MSRRKAWLGNLLLAGTAFAVAVTVAEVALRIAAPQPTGLSHQDRYGLPLHWPGIVRKLPQFGTTVSFNSAGMRDREHPLEKPPGVYRVMVLGDSFMEALQVEFEESLPSLLERELGRRTGRKVEVWNAGVSGWGTDDELRYLTRYGLQWKPDLILVAMTLHNDVSDNMREDWHTLEAGRLVEKSRAPMSAFQFRTLEVKAYLATRFQLYQLWRKVRHGSVIRQVGQQLNLHIVELFREPPSEPIERGYQLTDLLLERLDTVARANGARMAMVLLPLKVQLSDSAFSEFVREAGATPEEMPLERPQLLMTATASRLGAPLVDLLPSFREAVMSRQASLYAPDGHWNRDGHRLATEVVVEGLINASAIR